jgi:hypothetical protein
MLVFSTQLCELLPLQPSLWFNSPSLREYVQCAIYSVLGGGGGVWGSVPQTEKHLLQSPFTGQFL